MIVDILDRVVPRELLAEILPEGFAPKTEIAELAEDTLIGALRRIPGGETGVHELALTEAGYRWATLLANNQADIIYFKRPTLGVRKALRLEMRDAALEEPPLTLREHLELGDSYGVDEGTRAAFEARVIQRLKEQRVPQTFQAIGPAASVTFDLGEYDNRSSRRFIAPVTNLVQGVAGAIKQQVSLQNNKWFFEAHPLDEEDAVKVINALLRKNYASPADFSDEVTYDPSQQYLTFYYGAPREIRYAGQAQGEGYVAVFPEESNALSFMEDVRAYASGLYRWKTPSATEVHFTLSDDTYLGKIRQKVLEHKGNMPQHPELEGLLDGILGGEASVEDALGKLAEQDAPDASDIDYGEEPKRSAEIGEADWAVGEEFDPAEIKPGDRVRSDVSGTSLVTKGGVYDSLLVSTDAEDVPEGRGTEMRLGAVDAWQPAWGSSLWYLVEYDDDSGVYRVRGYEQYQDEEVAEQELTTFNRSPSVPAQPAAQPTRAPVAMATPAKKPAKAPTVAQCICTECGTIIARPAGKSCADVPCPECGTMMMGEGVCNCVDKLLEQDPKDMDFGKPAPELATPDNIKIALKRAGFDLSELDVDWGQIERTVLITGPDSRSMRGEPVDLPLELMNRIIGALKEKGFDADVDLYQEGDDFGAVQVTYHEAEKDTDELIRLGDEEETPDQTYDPYHDIETESKLLEQEPSSADIDYGQSPDEIAYKKWLREVDRELRRRYCVDSEGIPDWTYRDAFDAGWSAKNAARDAYQAASGAYELDPGDEEIEPYESKLTEQDAGDEQDAAGQLAKLHPFQTLEEIVAKRQERLVKLRELEAPVNVIQREERLVRIAELALRSPTNHEAAESATRHRALNSDRLASLLLEQDTADIDYGAGATPSGEEEEDPFDRGGETPEQIQRIKELWAGGPHAEPELLDYLTVILFDRQDAMDYIGGLKYDLGITDESITEAVADVEMVIRGASGDEAEVLLPGMDPIPVSLQLARDWVEDNWGRGNDLASDRALTQRVDTSLLYDFLTGPGVDINDFVSEQPGKRIGSSGDLDWYFKSLDAEKASAPVEPVELEEPEPEVSQAPTEPAKKVPVGRKATPDSWLGQQRRRGFESAESVVDKLLEIDDLQLGDLTVVDDGDLGFSMFNNLTGEKKTFVNKKGEEVLGDWIDQKAVDEQLPILGPFDDEEEEEDEDDDKKKPRSKDDEDDDEATGPAEENFGYVEQVEDHVVYSNDGSYISPPMTQERATELQLRMRMDGVSVEITHAEDVDKVLAKIRSRQEGDEPAEE